MQHPDEIVEDLYDWLGLDYTDSFKAVVEAETRSAHHYHSGHKYSIDKMGLTEEKIFTEFEEVFSYYEFDAQQFELPDHNMFWQINNWPKAWKLQRQQRQHHRMLRRAAKREQRQEKRGQSVA